MGYIVRGYCHATLQEAAERFLGDMDYYSALPIGTASVLGIYSYPSSNSVRYYTSSNASGNQNSTLTLMTCSTPGPMPWASSSGSAEFPPADEFIPFAAMLVAACLPMLIPGFIVQCARRLAWKS